MGIHDAMMILMIQVYLLPSIIPVLWQGWLISIWLDPGHLQEWHPPMSSLGLRSAMKLLAIRVQMHGWPCLWIFFAVYGSLPSKSSSSQFCYDWCDSQLISDVVVHNVVESRAPAVWISAKSWVRDHLPPLSIFLHMRMYRLQHLLLHRLAMFIHLMWLARHVFLCSFFILYLSFLNGELIRRGWSS